MILTAALLVLSVLSSLALEPRKGSYLASAILLLAPLFSYGNLGSLGGGPYTIMGMYAVILPAVLSILFFREKDRFTLFLLAVLTASASLVPASRNLLILVMSLEAVSVTAAALTFYHYRNIKLTLIYAIFSVTAAALMFFGLAIYYSGSLSFDLIKVRVTPSTLIGIELMLAAFIIKLALFPAHFWAVEVYSKSANSVALYLSSTVKAAAIMALSIFAFGPLGALLKQGYWELVAVPLILAAATVIVGAVGMISVESVRKILAYSSIAHSGFAVLALASPPPLSAAVLAFYALAYSIANSLVFYGCLHSKGEEDCELNELSSLRSRPALIFGFLTAVISLIGIPPTAGFDAKLFSLAALLFGKVPLALSVVLAIVATGFTAAAAYGYAKLMFASTKPGRRLVRESLPEAIVATYALILILLFFKPLLLTP